MYILFYDQNCDFCTRIVSSISKKNNEIVLRTLQSIGETDSQFLNFDSEIVMSAMWLYHLDNKELLQGYYAFKRIAMVYYKNPFLKFLFLTPISDFVGKRIYRLVAKNRRFAGCKSTSCGLH